MNTSHISQKQPFAGGKIVLSNGSAVDYDWLVLSMGSESSTLGIKGVKEFAVLFNTINDATQVKVDALSVCPVDKFLQRVASLWSTETLLKHKDRKFGL